MDKTFEPEIERIKERLRQERETFDQHKAHENRWFQLRLIMGYSSVVLLASIIVISSLILFNHQAYSSSVVTAAGAALFVDALGLVISIWKIVFNPDFMTKLAPITQLDKSEAKFFETPSRSSTLEDEPVILSAKYGARDNWMDVTPLLRAKVRDGKLDVVATNEEFGVDPFPGEPKKLDVTYLHHGKTYSKSISETQRLSIP
ncbi:MAG: DUF3395 domain-containing protein [Anaerolineales bacterium]|nr:DUF3395 domain-containing protein [Anaerolineales bacterium]MDW8162248.1 DUF3395 domain-containing protein [Anaerolineales bacterium]